MSDDLKELALRCEQASGPDKVLDFWIGVRCFPVSNDFSDEEIQEDIDTLGIEGMVIRAPYTSSIDAALTLIPEGWDGNGLIAWPGRKDGKLIANAVAVLHHDFSSDGGPKVEAYAATPALALCAAALRARSKDNAKP